MVSCKSLLEEKGIKPTQNRQKVLDCFISTNKGFSNTDLFKSFELKMDRVSVYRCLQDLLEAGLLQCIIDFEGIRIYYYETRSEKDRLQPHFKCKACQQISSLPELPSSYRQLLDGFKIEEAQFLLEGTCQQCQQKHV
ncbi:MULTISPECIES: Fur family transcriptional regulator [unclassified Siphonobacter]|uniref:Fur family transcriptional regulator n=1 Tax=unclassified Siphonobacter TaxID=2635712 RepID=UPI000CA7BC99|nr:MULTISPECIES: transcriptional repressor [unclassified Siphonobacter]MDQ1090299.1 Fur family ferric uptake transcriptional regulator [Siphonobacter sp. SORGH_AS_1065]PKK35010.1 hypothetical protein BWI96_19465 [Siphonobacter sp. SORGH_AS_0500]